jgi:hypothetical protein
MSKVRFITTEYLFKFTSIDENVDADLLTPFILQSQDINIQQAIGNSLYVKLKNDVPTNSVSGYYLTLLKEYIQPAQAQWTLYYAIPFINYKFTNKAVSQRNSDNSNPSSVDDLRWLRDQVRDTAEFLTRRITEYIMTNTSQFPEYFTTTGPYQIKPKKNNYFSGVYLGRSNKGGGYKPGYRDDDCWGCSGGEYNY